MASYVGLFRVPESGAIIPKIANKSLITMNVSELVTLQGEVVNSNALIEFTNVDIDEGKIPTVVVEHKLATEADTEWKAVVFQTKSGSNNGQVWIGTDQAGEFLIPNIEFQYSGLNHDFRAYFLNADGELAIDKNNSNKSIGVSIAEGGAGFVECLNVVFNGKTDLSEYPAATNVLVTNADVQTGGTFDAPANLPVGGIARLEWDNMKLKGTLTNHLFANGTTGTVTAKQWRTLLSYKVFMCIAVTKAPTNQYPEENPLDGFGNWYLVGDSQNNFLEINCPQDKKIGFFVACKLHLTGISVTDPIPKISYDVY